MMRRLLLLYTYSHFPTGGKRGSDFPKRENRRCILTTPAPSRPIGPNVFRDLTEGFQYVTPLSLYLLKVIK
jgi:hypothetical protein